MKFSFNHLFWHFHKPEEAISILKQIGLIKLRQPLGQLFLEEKTLSSIGPFGGTRNFNSAIGRFNGATKKA